jgi:hypothetical protein
MLLLVPKSRLVLVIGASLGDGEHRALPTQGDPILENDSSIIGDNKAKLKHNSCITATLREGELPESLKTLRKSLLGTKLTHKKDETRK